MSDVAMGASSKIKGEKEAVGTVEKGGDTPASGDGCEESGVQDADREEQRVMKERMWRLRPPGQRGHRDGDADTKESTEGDRTPEPEEAN